MVTILLASNNWKKSSRLLRLPNQNQVNNNNNKKNKTHPPSSLA
jgi:hypothetical protein